MNTTQSTDPKKKQLWIFALGELLKFEVNDLSSISLTDKFWVIDLDNLLKFEVNDLSSISLTDKFWVIDLDNGSVPIDVSHVDWIMLDGRIVWDGN